MRKLGIFFLAAFIFIPQMAYAQIVIHGEGGARDCYLKVLTGDQGRFKTRKDCITASQNPALKRKDRAATYVNIGILFMRAEKYDDANDWYNKALKLMPDLAEIHINQSVVYIYEGRPHEAITAINTALELETDKRAEALFNRSIAYDRLGDFTQAYKDLKEVLALKPDWPPALKAIGRYDVAPAPSASTGT